MSMMLEPVRATRTIKRGSSDMLLLATVRRPAPALIEDHAAVRRMILAAILAMAALCVWVNAAHGGETAPVTVGVRPHVEVIGDWVPLAICLDAGALSPELAEAAKTLFVGPAPAVHDIRRIPVSALRAALRKLGAGDGIRLSGPEEIEVVRSAAGESGRRLEGAWEQAIRAYLGGRTDLTGAEIGVQILTFSPSSIDIGPEAIRIEGASPTELTTLGASIGFRGRIVGGPGETVGGECVARIHAYRNVCVAARAIRAGETLKPAAGVLRRIDVIEGEQYLTETSALASQRSLRPLAAGAPIAAADLQPPPCVRGRDEVAMVLDRGGARLRMRGIAMREGAVGEIIPVQNSKTQKIVQARVLGSGQVEVLP